ncbi:MAG: hypothetical protein IPL51_13150 [Candidatus Competibacteraceae bacterium]|nr:hypothetical protein [Candidatus Competibacteraceae bacterium]
MGRQLALQGFHDCWIALASGLRQVFQPERVFAATAEPIPTRMRRTSNSKVTAFKRRWLNAGGEVSPRRPPFGVRRLLSVAASSPASPKEVEGSDALRSRYRRGSPEPPGGQSGVENEGPLAGGPDATGGVAVGSTRSAVGGTTAPAPPTRYSTGVETEGDPSPVAIAGSGRPAP